MLHDFLADNRDALIARCIDKATKRPKSNAGVQQLENGIPLFIKQLTKTLEAEQEGNATVELKISGSSGGDGTKLSEMGEGATAHGAELLKLGYTVDQVVHDYGDLCQAITDLALERGIPFSVDEFRTLNRCLDNAIANAVTEFNYQRESIIAHQQWTVLHERLGFLIHELRNSLNAAMLAVQAMESGSLPITGATGGVLKRSHAAMFKLIKRSLDDVRSKNAPTEERQIFSLAAFIAEAGEAADLDAKARGCAFTVADMDPCLGVNGNREQLLAALANLLQNAFKFTQPHTEVTLNAYSLGERVLIDVKDNCGGLPPGNAERMFKPFTQQGNDKSGLGLGLSIARQSVMADGGVLSVRDVPGIGCIFTISLPRHTLP